MGYATGFYSQSASFQDVMQLHQVDGFNFKAACGTVLSEVGERFTNPKACLIANASKGSMIFSYAMAGINVGQTIYSAFSDNPEERAAKRGYKLR